MPYVASQYEDNPWVEEECFNNVLHSHYKVRSVSYGLKHNSNKMGVPECTVRFGIRGKPNVKCGSNARVCYKHVRMKTSEDRHHLRHHILIILNLHKI